MRALLLAVCALGWVAGAQAQAPSAASVGGELRYELPEVGSYELPVIQRVREHSLLGSTGERVPVLRARPGAVTLVGFVYLHCADPTGCPLSLATLQRLDNALAAKPQLSGRVRLVTVSFDPVHDTPKAMAELRGRMAPRTGWRFLTAASEEELRPVLEDFGQDAVPLQTRAGSDAALFQHVAKVFLVDADGGVRNIYSAGFLDHRLLLRDVETLLAKP
jgi:cytochrome oxidase Cu insertion factor (SCO1/SenC/PrrC family)